MVFFLDTTFSFVFVFKSSVVILSVSHVVVFCFLMSRVEGFSADANLLPPASRLVF